MRTLVWFRSDLRVTDNTALRAACHQATDGVAGVFLITPGQWAVHDMAPARQSFLLANGQALQTALATLGIPLWVETVPDFSGVPEALARVARQVRASDLHANREYGVNEKRRDAAVVARLAVDDVTCHWYHDQTILPPGLTTRAGRPYTVFTPFRRAWYQRWHETPVRPGSVPAARAPLSISLPDGLAEGDTGLADWPAGEAAAQARLESFAAERLADYVTQRDFPALAGTSRLSAYLSAGVLSPRQCLAVALRENRGDIESGHPGAVAWINELIWRDFYIHILDSFPRVSCHRAFRPETEYVAWRDAPADFAAWCAGRTGYPLVDAAMRQLNAIGWMHNRLRMVCAMFLSKHLLLDWRQGERYFMSRLIDGHLAANNGGWQWAASTGTDAAPYFRVFNPWRQAARFDPEAAFIRRWVPELAALEARTVLAPGGPGKAAPSYPTPIVDHALARRRAIAAFRALPREAP